MHRLVPSQQLHRTAAGLDYETMLFIDGTPAKPPFGDMFGNRMQGIFQRYGTEDGAKQGHQQFVEKVKQVLIDRAKTHLARKD